LGWAPSLASVFSLRQLESIADIAYRMNKSWPALVGLDFAPQRGNAAVDAPASHDDRPAPNVVHDFGARERTIGSWPVALARSIYPTIRLCSWDVEKSKLTTEATVLGTEASISTKWVLSPL